MGMIGGQVMSLAEPRFSNLLPLLAGRRQLRRQGLRLQVQLTLVGDGRRHRARHAARADAPVGQKCWSSSAAFYVNTLRSIPLVMVILWFFLLILLLIGRPLRRPARRSSPSRVRGGLLLRDHTRRHPERAAGQVYAGYAMGMDYRQTMQLIVLPQAFPQHAAGAADADHHPVPGHQLVYAIGAYDLLKGLRGGRQELQPPGRDVPARRRRLFRDLLQPVDARAPAAEKIRSSASQAQSHHRSTSVNVSKWYGSFQVLTDCTTQHQQRARSWSSAARRVRARAR